MMDANSISYLEGIRSLTFQGGGKEVMRVTSEGELIIHDPAEAAKVLKAEWDKLKPLPIDEGLVERVARAIYEASRPFVLAGNNDVPGWSEGQRQIWQAISRAAIEVMLGR